MCVCAKGWGVDGGGGGDGAMLAFGKGAKRSCKHNIVVLVVFSLCLILCRSTKKTYAPTCSRVDFCHFMPTTAKASEWCCHWPEPGYFPFLSWGKRTNEREKGEQ